MAEHRSTIIRTAIACVLVLAVVGGGFLSLSGAQGATRYRTAEAELADVSEALSLSGQLAAATTRDVVFQVDGTVAEVSVEVGQEVSAGEQLAALDTTPLDAEITSAQEAVARAEQGLEDDLATQSTQAEESSASSSDASRSSATGGSDGASATPRSSAIATSTTQDAESSMQPSTPQTASSAMPVTDAQRALLAQYFKATDAQEQSRTALLAAQQQCEPFQSVVLAPEEPVPTPQPSVEPSAVNSVEPTQTQSPEPSVVPSSPSTTEPAIVPTAAPTSVEPTQTQSPEPSVVPSSPSTTEPAIVPTAAPTAAPSSSMSPTIDNESDVDTGIEQSTAADLTSARLQLEACQDALEMASRGQQVTADEQSEVNRLAEALDKAVSQAGTSSSIEPQKGSTAAEGQQEKQAALPAEDKSGTGQAQQVSEGVGSSGGSEPIQGSATKAAVISAEQILADQAAVDLSEAQLGIAEEDLTFATLTSPIAGKVVSVGLAAGDATGGSITVQSESGYVIDLTVSLTRINDVSVGQSVDVSLPASGQDFPATVSAVGVLNVSESLTPAYTLVIAVDTGGLQPRIGATARASIHLADEESVLTVPTSAIWGLGAEPLVKLLVDGVSQDTKVTVGAVGAERTQISDGVVEGDMVILADTQSEIASETATTDNQVGGPAEGGGIRRR